VPERTVRRSNHAGTEGTAAEIFRNANAARRAGDFGDARRLYTRLIAKYPGTDEARLPRCRSASSCSPVEKRPKPSVNSPLSLERAPAAREEALVSQAESLRAMNRGGDERKTWLRLLAIIEQRLRGPREGAARRSRARVAGSWSLSVRRRSPWSYRTAAVLWRSRSAPTRSTPEPSRLRPPARRARATTRHPTPAARQLPWSF